MKLSIVIPFYNEADNVDHVIGQTRIAHPDAQIIAVDDGSTDDTAKRLKAWNGITTIFLPENSGQGVAVYRGFCAATGDILASIDGDGQNDPRDIHTLIEALDTVDCAWGYRACRADPLRIRIASRIANASRKAFLGDDHVRDAGCGLRAFKAEHIRHLWPFEGLHRFMPAIFAHAGLRIAEVPVGHNARRSGVSKYTINGRLWRGIRDIVVVKHRLYS